MAGLLGWGWWSARQEGATWKEASELWEASAQEWRDTAARSIAQTDAALALGTNWKDAALIAYAASFQAFGTKQQ